MGQPWPCVRFNLSYWLRLSQTLVNALSAISEGGITGRGCSTKDKVYYKECETNSYGEGTEKFCYCNFYLCNTGHRPGPHTGTLAVIISSLGYIW